MGIDNKITMDKKGEAFFLLGIIIIGVIGGIVAIKDIQKEKQHYILDLENHFYYNLSSMNQECNIDNIRIPSEYFEVTNDITRITEEGFELDDNNPCN